MKDLINYAKQQIRDDPYADKSYWLGFMDGVDARINAEKKANDETVFFKAIGERIAAEYSKDKIEEIYKLIDESTEDSTMALQIFGHALLAINQQ